MYNLLRSAFSEFRTCDVSVKLTRLKQAKEEADREVANYRAQMEAEYQKSLSEVIAS